MGGPATGGARRSESRLAALGVLALVVALAIVGVLATRGDTPTQARGIASAPAQEPGVGLDAAPAGGPAPRPDVLVVGIDGIGPSDVAAFGGTVAPTPTLDALAFRGVVYADTYATSPWAAETLASALTGLVRPAADGPSADGPSAGGDSDPPPTLAEELRYLGYRTALVRAHARHRTVADTRTLAPEERGFDSLLAPDGHEDRAGARAGAVVAAAVEWLDRSVAPSLLVVTLADPRPPHHRYEGLVAAADASYVGPARAGLPHDDLLRTAPAFAEVDRARLAALHASEVVAADRALERLVEAVRTRRAVSSPGVAPVVAVVGLRAPALGRGGRWGLVPSLDPEDLRVPMLMDLPSPLGAETGASREPLQGVIDAPTSVADLAPTLLDALGGTPRLDLDGRSVFPGVRRSERPIRAATARGVRAAMHVAGDRALVLHCDPVRAEVHARVRGAGSNALVSAPRWEAAASGSVVSSDLTDLRGVLGAWMGAIGVARGDEPVRLRTVAIGR
ncbi:MAG: sulfatase-like hydrolase/transferase [Planctomycetota bacterium]